MRFLVLLSQNVLLQWLSDRLTLMSGGALGLLPHSLVCLYLNHMNQCHVVVRHITIFCHC